MEPREQLHNCHSFQVGDRSYIFEPENVAIFEVDDSIYEFYDSRDLTDKTPPEQWLAARHGTTVAAEILDDLRALRLLGPPIESSAPVAKPGLSGITLNVTHGCNLSCTYCFAEQGDYGLGRSKMSPETAATAIDWFADRCRETGPLTVMFFGGEPLMNMKAIRAAVKRIRKRCADRAEPIRFQMSTNGTLLNDKNVSILAELGIRPQVSIDGKPQQNDETRPFKNGRGSYEMIAKGIDRLKTRTGKVALRATLLSGHAQFFETATHFTDELQATRVNFEPLSGFKGGSGLGASDIDVIKYEWSRVADECYERAMRGEIWPIGKLMGLIGALHKRRRSYYGCTAGMSALVVAPNGDLYPCHRFVGNSDWKTGNIFNEEDSLEDTRSKFVKNSVNDRKACRSCWAKYLCAGRCVHEAMEVTGSIAEPDPTRCDMMRHICEEALKLYVRLKPHEEDILASCTGTQVATEDG